MSLNRRGDRTAAKENLFHTISKVLRVNRPFIIRTLPASSTSGSICSIVAVVSFLPANVSEFYKRAGKDSPH